MTSAYSAEFEGRSYGVGSAEFFQGGDHFEIHPEADVFKGSSHATATALKGLEPGNFLLFPESFSGIDPEDLTGVIREPKENELGKTRERNTQGLIFGQLILRSKSDKEKNTLVAVKPFDNLALALNELAATDYVNKSNMPNSFMPLGFHRFEDGAYGFLTAYEPEVVSLDNIFWDEANHPTVQQARKALNIGAFSLGAAHREGLTHGDFQVKNATSDNHGPRFVDLATARGFPVGQNGRLKIDAVRGRTWTDVDTFLGSLNTGIEDPADHGDYRELILEEFAPVYFELIGANGTKVPEESAVSRAAIESMIEN